ncbi:hypothetical protein NDU88_001010 [Pleurodeles waltl]|uniref:Secreted protein n=1 Tax=Pleurodeles waltl TaxID=8319 RepID=A0AAV7U6X2_PLEWA|nr:hypothetical protein NDU88_001010 [Pleurodeles waltl]
MERNCSGKSVRNVMRLEILSARWPGLTMCAGTVCQLLIQRTAGDTTSGTSARPLTAGEPQVTPGLLASAIKKRVCTTPVADHAGKERRQENYNT